MKTITLLCIALMVDTASAQQQAQPPSSKVPDTPHLQSDSPKDSTAASEGVGIFTGLRAVFLGVDVSPLLERGGLPKATIQEDAELKLRLAGIRVLTHEESVEIARRVGPPASAVFIHVQVVPEIGQWVYLIEVKLRDRVRLGRHISTTAFQIPLVRFGWPTDQAPPDFDVDTWVSSTLGVCDESKLYTLRDTIKDSIDAFVNSYLRENPKQN